MPGRALRPGACQPSKSSQGAPTRPRTSARRVGVLISERDVLEKRRIAHAKIKALARSRRGQQDALDSSRGIWLLSDSGLQGQGRNALRTFLAGLRMPFRSLRGSCQRRDTIYANAARRKRADAL